MSHHLDEIDRRILHALMSDARNTSAPMIAAGPKRVRGDGPEPHRAVWRRGVIRGYTAIVDFEQADGRLTSVFMCTVPADERERLALAARSIPGVINVRVLMAGRRDLQVVAVGEETSDLREIAGSSRASTSASRTRSCSRPNCTHRIRDFDLSDDAAHPVVTDTVTLADGTAVIEVCVTDEAPIVGLTPTAAREEGILSAKHGRDVDRARGVDHPSRRRDNDPSERRGDGAPKDASAEEHLTAFVAPEEAAESSAS